MRGKESKDKIDKFMTVATEILFTQMSTNAGILFFEEKVVTATVKEYRKIYKGPMEGKPVVTIIDSGMLYYKGNRKALDAVNLIKEKISRIIKAKKYADVRKQKSYLKEPRYPWRLYFLP